MFSVCHERVCFPWVRRRCGHADHATLNTVSGRRVSSPNSMSAMATCRRASDYIESLQSIVASMWRQPALRQVKSSYLMPAAGSIEVPAETKQ